MNDTSLELDLRDLFRTGPQAAPHAAVDGALARAATVAQRRPRLVLLDPRAWPPPRRSVGDPAVHRAARLLAIALGLLLVATLVAVGASLLDRPPLVTIVVAGTLEDSIDEPRATLWTDGRILVQGSSTDAYLFDPESGKTSQLAATSRLAIAEAWQSTPAVAVLTDGRVAMLGSANRSGDPIVLVLGFLEPSTGELTLAEDLPAYRFGSAALVLGDGRVVLSGGLERGSSSQPIEHATVEIFDPASGTTSQLAPMLQPRLGHVMLELQGGRVLIAGGSSFKSRMGGEVLEVEVYDLASGSSKVVGMINPGFGPLIFPLVRLADGRVLIQGGAVVEEPCASPVPRTDAPAGIPSGYAIGRQPTFVFDPRTDRLVSGPVLPSFKDHIVALADGRALAFGSRAPRPVDCAAEPDESLDPWLGVVDIGRNRVYESNNPAAAAASLAFDIERFYAAGVLLPDGRVALIAEGGEGSVPNQVDLVSIGP